MDEIRIDNLEVYAYHGVLPEEQSEGQYFYVNATLYTDTKQAGLQDKLEHSTHYGDVCHFITDWLLEHRYNLIEAAAEYTANEVLLHFSNIKAIDFELRKPYAPIGLPFNSVSVMIHREWHRVYVGMGSNMGDKEGFLRMAVEEMEKDSKIKFQKKSENIVTKPYGEVEQDDFLNCVVILDTLYDPEELYSVLQGIEEKAGRTRELKWGPRTLDLDILFYDSITYDDNSLIIPHIDMQNREFVLQSMVELQPGLRHPVLQKTMIQLLQELQAN